MPFRRIHKVVTYLMAAQGLGLLALSGELTLPGSVLVLAALAASWFAEGDRFASRRWVNIWNGLTVAVFVVQIVRWIAGEGLPVVAVQFAAFLQVNKMFNRRRQSDHDQIAILSLLHLIVSAILFTEVSYAIVFVLYTVVTPWMFVLGQIRREVEAKYWDRTNRQSLEDLDRVLNSRRIISGAFLASTALLSIPIYVMTAMLFLFFPRIGFGILASSDPAQRKLTGFSDQVVIGDLAPLVDDPTVVLRAEFPDGAPAQERVTGLYWRGSAHDSFDGTRWHRTLGHGVQVRNRGDHYLVSNGDGDGDPSPRGKTRIDVFLQPLYPKVVFLPQGTSLVAVPQPRPISVMGQKLRWGPGDEIRYSDVGGTGIHYQVFLDDGASRASLPSPYHGGSTAGPSSLDPYLQLPPLSDRFVSLASGFERDHPEPVDRALAVERWFRTEFGYTKTASREVPEGMTPVDAFLFEWREGNCEYFSTAMVLVMRETGVPARNVTGFIGGAWNDVGGYLAVREADAHSWVEVWDGERWVLLDPTPPAEMEPERDLPLFAWMSQTLDTMRLSWHKHIIAYDLTQQAELLRRSYHGVGSIRRFLSGMKTDSSPRLGAALRVVVPLVVIATLVGIWLALRRRRREEGPRRRRPSRRVERQVLSLMGLVDRRLESLGLARPVSRPPHTHAVEVADRLEDSLVLHEIVDVYNATRFGGTTVDPERLRLLRQRVAHIARTPVGPAEPGTPTGGNL